MALQVWLPLNGNLVNQGLTDVTAINNGATIDNNGKIGKCYSFDGNDDFISISCSDLYNTFSGGSQPFSIAFWVYHADTTRAVIFGDYGLSGTISFNIELTSDAHRVRFYWNAAPDKIFNTNSSVGINTWTHIVLVYDGNEICIYKNGVQQSDKYSGTLAAKSKTSGVFYLGRDQRTGATAFNGKLNDFRIYDHALSPREVKEISKGLVLHYPLAMPGGENLLKNSLTNFPELWSGSGDGRTLTTQSGVSVPEWGCNDGLRVYGKSGASSALCLLINDSTHGLTVPSTSVSGQKYTPSIYIKNNHQNTIYIAFNGIGTGQTINQGEIKKVILNATGNGKSYLQFTISASGANKEYDFTFWHPKIELGEVCTPWVPATTDSLYSAMGFNDGIEYDVSGYGHNGTKTGAFAYDSDTSRYNTSTVFSGSNHIAVGRLPITDELTYSWWGYMDNWSSLGGAMMCSVEGGGMGQQKGGSTGLWFICGTGTTSNNYGSGYQMPIPSAGWHMFTETWDGYRFKVYLDGELKFTNERYTTKTPVYYSQNYNFLFLGGESGGSATTPGDHFIGKLSDARVYATALSAEDVAELYNTPISLSNNGTLMGYEYVEV